MSILDQLKGELGALVGNASGGTGPIVEHVTAMVNDAGHGGLPGLVQQFRQAGLEGIINSWIGTGPNQPISAQQLQTVISGERLRQLAAKVGISPEQVAAGLATILPMVVNGMTPNGQVPPTPGAAR